VKVIHAGLGNVNVTDVNLAVAAKAIIIAFDVRIEADARRAAELNGVSIREYNVIYTLIEDIDKLLAGMLEPRFEEVVHGHAEVRAIFRAGRKTIAGGFVTDGVIRRQDRARLSRGGRQLWQGGIESLKRFKDDVNEVREGFEFGVALAGWDDIEVGDTLEVYSSERV
jgi:translation initiation factor IF-2